VEELTWLVHCLVERIHVECKNCVVVQADVDACPLHHGSEPVPCPELIERDGHGELNGEENPRYGNEHVDLLFPPREFGLMLLHLARHKEGVERDRGEEGYCGCDVDHLVVVAVEVANHWKGDARDNSKDQDQVVGPGVDDPVELFEIGSHVRLSDCKSVEHGEDAEDTVVEGQG